MTLLITTIILTGIVLVLASWYASSVSLRSLAQGLFVSYITILLIVAAGEAYFRYGHAESTAFYSLAHQNWLDRYWQTNDAGFRDDDWQQTDFSDKITIAAVGDSFTAGNGINNPADRYTDVLESLLDDTYEVVNLGESGSSTPRHLENLQAFDVTTPDVIIWQYFLNDIEFAALRVSSLPPVPQVPEIATQSHLLNFLYFRTTPPLVDYWGWQFGNYDNPVIWDLHRQELEAMINYADSIDAELIIILYPIMVDPVGSIPYVDRVAQAIEDMATNGVQIIKLFDAVAAWDVDVPLIVSPRDAHPSIEFNHYVGETLYQQVFGG